MPRPNMHAVASKQVRRAAMIAALISCGYAGPCGATDSNHYGVTISTQPTGNMAFNNGVYAAVADGANLNVTDLESALASGAVEVTTGNGPGGDEKGDLHVNASFTWAGGHTLTLDAYHSLFVHAGIVDAGRGGLALDTNDGGSGGTFVYDPTGNITIQNLQDILHINGVRFLLDGSVQSLAGDIEAKPGGNYALANNYDASRDGTYSASPVATTFTGSFDGLGNTISNLSIHAITTGGLFLQVQGTIRDLNLVNASIVETSGNSWVGVLAGLDQGPIENVTTSGSVRSSGGFYAGGVVGASDRSMTNCSSSASVVKRRGGGGGGLAGYIGGTVTGSFATGSVAMHGGGYAGGLVGFSQGAIDGAYATGSVAGGTHAKVGGLAGGMIGGSIANSYSTGSVEGGVQASVGGLIGALAKKSIDSVATSYSTGQVSAGAQGWIGGVLGADHAHGEAGCGCFVDAYWDTDASGITNPDQGSGNIPDEAGITGLSNRQLKSGLPQGFDPTIWNENRKLNHGLPYLIAVPPQ